MLQKDSSVEHCIWLTHTALYDQDSHWCSVCLKMGIYLRKSTVVKRGEAGGICAHNMGSSTMRNTMWFPLLQKQNVLCLHICSSLAGSVNFSWTLVRCDSSCVQLCQKDYILCFGIHICLSLAGSAKFRKDGYPWSCAPSSSPSINGKHHLLTSASTTQRA